MSKEFTCTQCRKKVITEREDTRHTDYSYGLCEECSSPTEVIPQSEIEPIVVQAEEKPNSLACRECEFIAKTEFGLQSHMRVHKQ